MRTSRLLYTRTVTCLALLAAASPAAWAQGRIECSTVSSKILQSSVRYCAFLPPGYEAAAPPAGAPAASARRYPVVYYLHGLGDSERSLIDSGGWNLVQ